MPLPLNAKITESFVFVDAKDVASFSSDEQFVSIKDIISDSVSYNISGEIIGYYGGTLTIIN